MHRSKHYNERIRAEQRAAEERRLALNRAELQIDRLFGSGAAAYGLNPLVDEIRELMYNAEVLTYDNELKDITLNVNSYIKVKISKSAKGKIIFLRSDAAVFKQEA